MMELGLGGARECGERKEGGVYVEVAHSPLGRPIDDFLLDPPQPIDAAAQQALGITPIGVSTITQDGVTHVVDWIGQNYYPNVEDWVSEARVMGISRRIPVTFDFSLLTKESRLLVIHAKAWIVNWPQYVAEPMAPLRCWKKVEGHPMSDMCVSLWKQDIEGGTSIEGGHPRAVVRDLVSGQYTGYCAPKGVEARYCPAFFGSFPIGNLAVIRAEDGSHEDALAKARKAHISVKECDE